MAALSEVFGKLRRNLRAVEQAAPTLLALHDLATHVPDVLRDRLLSAVGDWRYWWIVTIIASCFVLGLSVLSSINAVRLSVIPDHLRPHLDQTPPLLHQSPALVLRSASHVPVCLLLPVLSGSATASEFVSEDGSTYLPIAHCIAVDHLLELVVIHPHL